MLCNYKSFNGNFKNKSKIMFKTAKIHVKELKTEKDKLKQSDCDISQY